MIILECLYPFVADPNSAQAMTTFFEQFAHEAGWHRKARPSKTSFALRAPHRFSCRARVLLCQVLPPGLALGLRCLRCLPEFRSLGHRVQICISLACSFSRREARRVHQWSKTRQRRQDGERTLQVSSTCVHFVVNPSRKAWRDTRETNRRGMRDAAAVVLSIPRWCR